MLAFFIMSHYALFWNVNNVLQFTYFVNNGLQGASMNRRFLNIMQKMIQNFTTTIYRSFYWVNKGERWNWWTRGLNGNSVADSFSASTFLFTLPRLFLLCLLWSHLRIIGLYWFTTWKVICIMYLYWSVSITNISVEV